MNTMAIVLRHLDSFIQSRRLHSHETIDFDRIITYILPDVERIALVPLDSHTQAVVFMYGDHLQYLSYHIFILSRNGVIVKRLFSAIPRDT